MKKYDSYKDSGVKWLGEIPKHWNILKMRFLFKDVSVKNKPELELLSVTQNQGVVPRNMVENRMVMPTGSLESFKVISKGDFAISLRSFEGGLEYSDYEGLISPAYTVLKAQKEIIHGYYKYLFKSFSFIGELQLSIVGIREGKNISYEELKYSYIQIPPLSEQQAIANFLDEKTVKIDQAIAIKEKEIELLKERRQILIQELVTGKKVWDGNQWTKPTKTKDSGVDWIGEIPEDWEELANKYIFRIKKNLVGKDSANYDLLSLTLQGVKLRDMENPEGKFPAEFDTYQKVVKGDFVFCLFDVEETPRTVGLSQFHGMITGAYTVMDLVGNINSKFLYYLYLFIDDKKRLRNYYRGLRNTIPKDSFMTFKSLVPPISTQEIIVNKIEQLEVKIEK